MNRRKLVKSLGAIAVAVPSIAAASETEGPWMQYDIKDSIGRPVSNGWFRRTKNGTLFADFVHHFEVRK